MNDFTKEELQSLVACISVHCPDSVDLKNKIQSMIDDYLEHEWNISDRNFLMKLMLNPGECFPVVCKKCGVGYK